MSKYLNKKAGVSYLQILILILGIIAVSYLIGIEIEEVNAQDFGEVCCEETLNGNTCQSEVSGQCSPNFNVAPTNCENTEFCEIGCCVSKESGICNKRTSRRDCNIMNGSFHTGEFCNIQECEEGCCIIGNNVMWSTEKNCEFEGNSKNKDISTQWLVDENHNTYLKCLFSAEKDIEGACVFEDEDGKVKCVYTSLEECIVRTGKEDNFNREKICSDPELNTTCEAREEKRCIDGEEDVYWFDSCDNKEDVAEDCNLYTGTYCGKEGGDYICKDMSCIVDGMKRKNGESWCEYDGTIGVATMGGESVPKSGGGSDREVLRDGFGSDPAGSRHVKHICYMGTERIEPCADFRNEICVETKSTLNGEEYSEASCRVNQWRTCMDYNRLQGSEKMIDKCNKNPDCFVKHIDMDGSFNFKVCLPGYPPGFKLFSEDLNEENYITSTPADGICSTATLRCTETWICGIFGCICVDNCRCHTSYFTEKMNEFCISLGDCGAYINYDGEYTDGGYSVRVVQKGEAAPPRLTTGYLEMFTKLNIFNGIPANPGSWEFFESLSPEFLTKVPERNYTSNLSALELELMAVAGAFGSPLLLKMFSEDSNDEEEYVRDLRSSRANYATFTNGASTTKAGIDAQIVYDKKEPKDFSMIAAMVAGIIAYVITQSIMVAMIAALVAFLFAIMWVKYVDIDFTCMPWEPPYNGDNCNACNELEVPCTEYRCHSLGQLCKFINKGTDNELCISEPENKTAPKIQPLYNYIEEGHEYYKVDEGGFEIVNSTDKGCIEAFTSVKMGIKVSPFARCKIGLDPTEDYEDMPEKFGSRGNSILPAHKIDVFLPSPEAFKNAYNLTEEQIEEMGKINYYVRCKTASGIVNRDVYTIKTCVRPGPDFTAPRIGLTNPENGAHIKYQQEKQDLKMYVNEPANCKWSLKDQDYDLMENDFTCEKDLTKYGVFGLACNTTLTKLQNNSKFYFRCQDTSENTNTMSESYFYELKVSKTPLKIDEFLPSYGEIITEGFEPIKVMLKVGTSGGAQNGISTCSWKMGERYKDRFTKTNSSTHSYELTSAIRGDYDIDFECEDVAGNMANASTFFKVKIDSFGPKIIRLYYDGGLKIFTSEEAECRYSFDRKFIWENATVMGGMGLEHYAEWKLRDYYIQCQDEYNNKGGKIRVKAFELMS